MITKKINTKGKLIPKHTNILMYTYWEDIVKGEGSGRSQD